MSENDNDNNEERSVQLSKLVKAEAQMIAQYATRLLNDQRAQEFAARVSILCKTEPKFIQAIEEAPDSFLSAMMACVHLDLMPNTPQQHAFLIPFAVDRHGKKRMEVQFQMGYKGLKELAYRTGEIKSLNSELVFKGDVFDVEMGTDRKLTHKPNFDIDRTNFDDVTHVYITTVLTNGEKPFYLMTKKEIEKIREAAKAKNFGKDSPAWTNWWDQQAKKTAMKRATKELPSSSKDQRLALAVELDSRAEAHKLLVDEDGNFKDKKMALPELSDAEKEANKAEAKDIAASRKATVAPVEGEVVDNGGDSNEPE